MGVTVMLNRLAPEERERTPGYRSPVVGSRTFGVDVIAAAPGPIRIRFAARASMTMGLAQTRHDVAGPTLDALGRRGTVRPGGLSKLLEVALMSLPRRGRVRMMGVRHGRNDKEHDNTRSVPSAGISHERRR
jgi:hypothetical protein